MKHLLLLFLPVWLCTTQVSAEYFTIKNYQVNVTFTEEGYADFEEIIEVEFSQPRHGVFRFIPYRNKVNNKNLDFFIKDIRIDGHNFSSSKENENIVLRIGDADKYVDGRQVYRIHYRVLNSIISFEEHDQFYWDVLGKKWDVDIENFEFVISFPGKVNLLQEDVYAYSGLSGSTTQGNLDIQVTQHQITGKTTGLFSPGEAVTVAVRIDKGIFKGMGFLESFWLKHKLLIPAAVFFIIGLLAKIAARNRRQTIMTEYFPPPGISPAIAGGFVDHSVDSNDVLSLIPHLANKGYLRMEAVPGKGFFKKDNIIFYKLKDAGQELMIFEKQFFDALFSSGGMVELDDLKDKFYTHMTSVKETVREWIKLQGWYESDQQKFGCFTGGLGVLSLAWGAFAIFKLQNMDGIALGVTGFILLFLASRFNKRSPAGNQTYQKLEGFRQFVSKAERPVIERLMKDDPLYYDATMPYALAFGYLSQWNKHFEGLLTQPPSWYSSPMMYGGNMHQSWSTFSESFPSEINNIGSVFSSSPSSSSGGGGFSGGGSSGGGGGGGGGGSW